MYSKYVTQRLYKIMKIHLMPILIYYLNNIFIDSLQSNLLNDHILRKKINKRFDNEYGKEIFLNIDEYEYPRANKTLKQLHIKRWLNYYKCLEEKYMNVKGDKTMYPSALIALEGTSVTLECQVCISPIETQLTSLIKWNFNSNNNNSTQKTNSRAKSILENDDHIFYSLDNRYITMYNIKLEQAGIYWCEIGNTVGSVYHLHIDNDLETVKVYPNRAALVEYVMEYKLKVYYVWTTWSSCSTCDKVGIKLRYGYCTVSLVEIPEQKDLINEGAWPANKLRYTKQKIIENDQQNRVYENTTSNATFNVQLRMALILFKNKLPCKSKLLPEQVRLISIIQKKKTAIMRQYCKKKCQKNIIFEVRDEKGNVLESANNSAGIFSMIQGMPELLPSIIRNVIYAKHNKKLKLVCPGNLNTDFPMIWQIDNKTIISTHIKSQSNGRININAQMQITFESVQFNDANIYSCWQNNEIVGIIKLNVIEEIEFNLNYYVILIGVSVIISIVLIIFWKAYKKRIRYTMH